MSFSKTIILVNVGYPRKCSSWWKEKKSSAVYSKLQVLRFRYLYFGFVSWTLINIDGFEHAKWNNLICFTGNVCLQFVFIAFKRLDFHHKIDHRTIEASFLKRYGKCTWWLTECFTIMNCGAGSEISYRLLRLHQNEHGTYLGSNNKFNDLCDIVTSISIMCVTVLWTNGNKSPRCEFLCRNTHNKNTKLDLWPRVTKIPDEMKWKESKIIPIRSVTAHRLI